MSFRGVFLLAALLALHAPLLGAEAPAPTTEDEAPAPQAGAPAPRAGSESPAAEQAGADAAATEDVFVPTIEVSEDTSVPFPVDI